MTTYSQVWQTWHLVSSPITVQQTPQPGMRQPNTIGTDSVRQIVQTARVAKRISIATLASQIQCDVGLLAAFERGESILSVDINKRLHSVLGITSM